MRSSEKRAIIMMINKLQDTYMTVADNRDVIEKYTQFESLDHTLDQMDELESYLKGTDEKLYYGDE